MSKISLTKKQLERILIYMQLNDHARSVVIMQKSTSGIGPNTYAQYYNQRGRMVQEDDVTDVETW